MAARLGPTRHPLSAIFYCASMERWLTDPLLGTPAGRPLAIWCRQVQTRMCELVQIARESPRPLRGGAWQVTARKHWARGGVEGTSCSPRRRRYRPRAAEGFLSVTQLFGGCPGDDAPGFGAPSAVLREAGHRDGTCCHSRPRRTLRSGSGVLLSGSLALVYIAVIFSLVIITNPCLRTCVKEI